MKPGRRSTNLLLISFSVRYRLGCGSVSARKPRWVGRPPNTGLYVWLQHDPCKDRIGMACACGGARSLSWCGRSPIATIVYPWNTRWIRDRRRHSESDKRSRPPAVWRQPAWRRVIGEFMTPATHSRGRVDNQTTHPATESVNSEGATRCQSFSKYSVTQRSMAMRSQ